MVAQISGSVGNGGKNNSADVRTVQSLLNLVPGGLGGPTPALDVDGLVGPMTINAISRFQKAHFGWGDGRVDPNGQTLAKLNGFGEISGDPAAMAAATALGNGGVPGAGTIDGASGPLGSLDKYGSIASAMGSVYANLGTIIMQVAPGVTIAPTGYVWTLKNSTAVVRMMPSGKTYHVPPSSMFFLGSKGAVPLSSVKWFQAGKTTPTPAGYAPAPYYQADKPGVSPGYFNQ